MEIACYDTKGCIGIAQEEDWDTYLSTLDSSGDKEEMKRQSISLFGKSIQYFIKKLFQ